MSDDLLAQLRTALGDDYSLERELGGGGMSRVFVARDQKLGREVVVKVLSPELAQGISAERFAREIRVAAMLQEPHIVPIHATGATASGLPYFTMPFVSGESLRVRMQEGPIPLSEAVGILRDIARALMYAHAHGVVHRDIKPENVLLSEGTAVVSDFGIAKAVNAAQTIPGGTSSALTATGTSIGTPAYMAPEQAAADPHIDLRADIYSWGMIAWELLSGAHPFAHRTTPRQLLTAQMSEVPSDLRDARYRVPAALADVVMRCLSKDPADRPASVQELLRPLEGRHSVVRDTAPQKRPVARIGALAVLVLVIAAVAFVVMRRSVGAPAAAAADDRSIAVMPFSLLGRDSTEAYLADGMTDELASELTKVEGLRVAARRSAYSYRNTTTPPREIGRALRVGMLLDGTVQHVQNRIRVRAQLTNVRDESVLWSSTFEGDARDIFALQDTITRAIVTSLRLTLNATTTAERASLRPKNLEAHTLYLRGRFEAGKHSEQGLQAALALFERAVAIDSSYAPPYVGMADAYGWLADSYYEPSVAYPKAKAAVTHAIELAPSLAEAHAVLAWILLAYDWNFIGAQSEALRAVTLDPSSALAHSNYSYTLLYRGQKDSALAEIRRAFALDPLSPSLSSNLEWHLLKDRRFADVVEQHKVTHALDPAYFFADAWDAVALRELGRYDESVAAYRAVQTIRGGPPPFGLAVTYARMGDTTNARAILTQILALGHTTSLATMGVAQIYTALGDRDNAFRWLDRARAARTNGILEVKYSAAFDALRNDPRLAQLLRSIGLGQ
ncbi:MAG: protein kinase [Gemmatimonadaceae bacterium]